MIEKRLRKKYQILYKYIENKAKINSKTKILNQQVNENENKMIDNKVDYDGEEGGVTRVTQMQKWEILTPNNAFTNYSINNNRCTSVSENNDNDRNKYNNNKDGKEEVNNIETNTLTTR